MADSGGTTSNATEGTGSAVSRQPVVYDYSQLNQFKLYLPIFPLTEWFVTRCNIPGVSMGQGVQATSLIDIPLIGDKLTYDDFYCTFIVDEQLKNYTEMHDWLINLGFPSDHAEFNAKARPDQFKRPRSQRSGRDTEGVPVLGFDNSDRDLYSNLDLFILSSKNNPVVKIQMIEAFPTSLTNIEYSQAETDTSYAECTVTFAYSYFTIEAVT